MGADVPGATFGVVGMGGIGEAVARRAHAAFGMPILYAGTTPKSDAGRDAAHACLVNTARGSLVDEPAPR